MLAGERFHRAFCIANQIEQAGETIQISTLLRFQVSHFDIRRAVDRAPCQTDLVPADTLEDGQKLRVCR